MMMLLVWFVVVGVAVGCGCLSLFCAVCCEMLLMLLCVALLCVCCGCWLLLFVAGYWLLLLCVVVWFLLVRLLLPCGVTVVCWCWMLIVLLADAVVVGGRLLLRFVDVAMCLFVCGCCSCGCC